MQLIHKVEIGKGFKIKFYVMKNNKLILLMACLFGPFICWAQYLKTNNFTDLGISTNLKQHAVSASLFHVHYLGNNKKFGVGYGVRYTGNFGSNSNFLTAPAKLTKSVNNMDTISFRQHAINSINIALYLQYLVFKKLAIEFNIDAVGFSFGPDQIANYNSNKRTNQTDRQVASVSGFNALLVDDNDIGSINSEFLIRYQFSSRVSLKAGMSYIYTEYTTNNKLFADNNRFRNKSVQGTLGLNLRIN